MLLSTTHDDDEKLFQVHSFVLYARSGYFRKLLTVKPNLNLFNLDTMDMGSGSGSGSGSPHLHSPFMPEIVCVVLEWIYMGSIKQRLEKIIIWDVYHLALLWDIPDLLQAVESEEVLMEGICSENFFEV